MPRPPAAPRAAGVRRRRCAPRAVRHARSDLDGLVLGRDRVELPPRREHRHRDLPERRPHVVRGERLAAAGVALVVGVLQDVQQATAQLGPPGHGLGGEPPLRRADDEARGALRPRLRGPRGPRLGVAELRPGCHDRGGPQPGAVAQRQLEARRAAERDAGVEERLVGDGRGDRVGEVGDGERAGRHGTRAVAGEVPRRDAVVVGQQRHDVLPQDRRGAERRPSTTSGASAGPTGAVRAIIGGPPCGPGAARGRRSRPGRAARRGRGRGSRAARAAPPEVAVAADERRETVGPDQRDEHTAQALADDPAAGEGEVAGHGIRVHPQMRRERGRVPRRAQREAQQFAQRRPLRVPRAVGALVDGEGGCHVQRRGQLRRAHRGGADEHRLGRVLLLRHGRRPAARALGYLADLRAAEGRDVGRDRAERVDRLRERVAQLGHGPPRDVPRRVGDVEPRRLGVRRGQGGSGIHRSRDLHERCEGPGGASELRGEHERVQPHQSATDATLPRRRARTDGRRDGVLRERPCRGDGVGVRLGERPQPLPGVREGRDHLRDRGARDDHGRGVEDVLARRPAVDPRTALGGDAALQLSDERDHRVATADRRHGERPQVDTERGRAVLLVQTEGVIHGHGDLARRDPPVGVRRDERALRAHQRIQVRPIRDEAVVTDGRRREEPGVEGVRRQGRPSPSRPAAGCRGGGVRRAFASPRG